MTKQKFTQKRDVNQPRRGLTWQASFTIGVLIVVALYIVGSVKGATVTMTPRQMVVALKAIQYPVRHPKSLTCRTAGTSFKCVAKLTHHRRRVFYAAPRGVGGWMCAGRTITGCVILRHGFYPAGSGQGWQEVAVKGWLENHGIDENGALPMTCTGTVSPVACTVQTSPPVTVTLSYHQVGSGYVETATKG